MRVCEGCRSELRCRKSPRATKKLSRLCCRLLLELRRRDGRRWSEGTEEERRPPSASVSGTRAREQRCATQGLHDFSGVTYAVAHGARSQAGAIKRMGTQQTLHGKHWSCRARTSPSFTYRSPSGRQVTNGSGPIAFMPATGRSARSSRARRNAPASTICGAVTRVGSLVAACSVTESRPGKPVMLTGGGRPA